MILGIGIDLIDSQRIEKLMQSHPERFVEKHFTANERAQGQQREKAGTAALFYAKRFAAKEAMVKAMGTGFTGGISFQDIEVSNNDKGRPSIICQGQALAQLKDLADDKTFAIHLSLSDEPPYAIAKVIVEVL